MPKTSEGQLMNSECLIRVRGYASNIYYQAGLYVEHDCSRDEFAALQACIDGLGSCDVFVLATANNVSEMPASLKRAFRIDHQIKVRLPKLEESDKKIIVQ